jgi:hypothetical protein
MPTIYLRPNAEQKARLAELSKATKAGPGPWKSENALMLELLDAHLAKLDGEQAPEAVSASPEPLSVDLAELGEPGALETAKITVRLPRFLKKRAEGRARLVGMGTGRWVGAFIQSNLMNLPVLTDRELQAVEVSIRELSAIGRNINQIARALNEAHYQTERVKVEKLAELAELIKSVRSSIRGLVRASKNSWKAEE